MTATASTIFRDFVMDGIPSSGANKPAKAAIRAWGTWLEGLYAAAQAGGGLAYETKADMDADLAHDANQVAWVMEDTTVANNGIYQKVGASGSGSWSRLGDLPYSIVSATNSGAGTANAVLATSSIPVSTVAYSQLISVPFTAANTGAMTLSINGETARDLVTNTGAAITSGYIKAGMAALVQLDTNGDYRLFSYGDASAIQTAAEAAQAAAEQAKLDAQAAAAGVNLPTLTSADKYKQLVVKSDGSGYDAVSDHLNCAQLGALPGIGTQDANMAAAISAAASAGLALFIPAGTYAFTKQVDFSALIGGKIILGGEVIFDFTGATAIADFPDFACILIDGDPLAALPDFASNQDKYNSGVTFATDPGLVEGDRFCIFNPTTSSWSGFRPVYYAGEFCQVADGSGGTLVRLYGALFDTYLASAVDIYKHPNKPISITGGHLTIKEPTAAALIGVAGFRANRIVDSDFSAIRPTRSGNAGMVINQCVGITGSGYNVRQQLVNANGTSYGVVFANSQDCVMDGIFEGGRHAVAHGGYDGVGSVPCRDIHVSGIVRNGPDAPRGIGAYNTHGNCEYCSFTGLMDGGASLNGDHITIKGEIRIKASQQGVAIYFGEMLGTSFDCSGVKIHATGDPSVSPAFSGTIDIGGSNTTALTSDTKRGGVLNFDGMVIDAPNTRFPFNIANRGYTGIEKITISMRGTTWRATDADDPIFLFLQTVSGNDIDYLNIEGLNNEAGGRWSIPAGTKVKGFSISGQATITPSASNTSATVNISFKAPKTPVVNHVLSSALSVGGKRVVTYTTAEAISGATLGVATSDSAVFSSTSAAALNWTATLDEF